MDLFKAEVEKLREIVHLWQDHPNEELEATFGINGHVDVSTFYAVIRRLQSKGYTLTQEPDKLNIITPAVERNAKSAIVPTGCRFTISGFGQIEQYCNDDTLTSKTYSVMLKDNTRSGAKLSLEDYDTSVKIRQEIELSSDGDTKKANEEPLVREILQRWPIQRKAFRMIRRWSSIDEAKGIRFDLSIVQQTKRTSKGEYKWETTFQKENFLKNPPVYEIEVELLHNDANATEEKSLKNLIRGMGEVLRGIQKNVLLIRKSVHQDVIRKYTSLVFPGATPGVSGPKFRGVNPETLQVDNMTSEPIKGRPNIRTNFNVTDKADGLRVMMFCNDNGELYLLDMNMNVYRTNLKSQACANTLLDAEWVSTSKNGDPRQYVMAFDIYIGLGGKVVTRLPFVQSDPDKKNEDRQTKFKEWFEAWNTSNPPAGKSEKVDLMKFIILPKTFYHGTGDTTIFQACERCLQEDVGRDYYTDGLILTSNLEPIPDGARVTFKQQYKWKPSNDNTIDFLVKIEKEDSGEDKITFTGDKEFKTLRLFVSASRETAYDDPRSTILNDLPLPGAKPNERTQLKPVIFTPMNYNDTMASVCYRKVHRRPGTDESFVACEVKQNEDESNKLTGEEADDPDALEAMGEPIQDGSIVEMRFEASNNPGWRWIPIRIRNDKTERFQRGQIEKTMNTDFVANSNWDSIYNPVTLHMITTGADAPLPEEINAISSILAERKDLDRKYYDRKAPKDDMMIVKGLSNFHNKWIKKSVLLEPTLKPEPGGPQKTLIDIACGKIGDVHKWIELQPSFVLGVDYAGDCITDKKDGAYRRFINVLKTYGRDNVPPMVFCVGDSSKQFITGEAAGDLVEDADILRAVFGKETEQSVPKYVDEVCAGKLSRGADVVACMFALHYFFRDKATFNGLLENLRNILKVGGYFVGCTFDGDAIFEFMRETKKDVAKVGKTTDDVEIWKLTKQYDLETDLPFDDEGFGNPLEVDFISIGLKHTEYLVPFKLLEEKMKSIGCRLLDETECSKLGFPGLKKSTRMFKDELSAAKKKAGKDFTSGMPDPVKQFSFLNRWFIFKRTGESYGAEAATVVEPSGMTKPKKTSKLKGEESAPRPASGVGEALESKEVEEVVAPVVGSPDPERKWSKAQIFEFGPAMGSKEKVGIKNARRILALNYPFILSDPENKSLAYPSIEHYLAAMKYKLATKPKRPDLASLFASTGAIHQEALTKLQLKQGAQKKPLSFDDKQAFINEETKKVLSESSKEGMAAKNISFDEPLWESVRDELVEGALKKRFERDEEFKSVLLAAKLESQYLLYTAYGDDHFGGEYSSGDKKIHGSNKVGRILMKLAGYTP